ncbi:MAG TPA: (2Fe-2S)-binding protein [Planctomycetota bacterium]|nr:(2Fe-2S)-binding protein [Planctomycetota bacterium]
MSGRIDASGERGVVGFTFAGRSMQGREGDTIAMALFAAGEQVLRNSSRDGAPRGVLCNMGICYECLVLVDGRTVRACTTVVRDGMRVERGGKP